MAGIHFKSVANQSRFTVIRNQFSHNVQLLNKDERRNLTFEMKSIVRDEVDMALRLYALSRQDSRIGFEASNHYYYRPIDLVEKVINCHYILGSLIEN